MASAAGSLFARLYAGHTGVDPYTTAVSDTYQDLFGEGSFTGKGIYDLDAFSAAMAGRVPENTMLSHDLFEGVFARAGLVTDVELFDEFPSNYLVSAARQHRWARGDWQLLPWIFGPRQSRSGRASIPLIGLWKMVDNLRRTLSSPASFATLLVGWTLPIGAASLWTGYILAAIALPTLLPVAAAIMPHRAGVSAKSHLRALSGDLRLALGQIAFHVTFMAHQAWLMADAIGRTLVRLYVTRRRLLEWVPAAQTKSAPRLDLVGYCRRMSGSVVLGAAAAIVASWAGPAGWLAAQPGQSSYVRVPGWNARGPGHRALSRQWSAAGVAGDDVAGTCRTRGKWRPGGGAGKRARSRDRSA
jgi:cyclic beta-1,2-glucan synthetase